MVDGMLASVLGGFGTLKSAGIKSVQFAQGLVGTEKHLVTTLMNAAGEVKLTSYLPIRLVADEAAE